jgi:hypothetical protein
MLIPMKQIISPQPKQSEIFKSLIRFLKTNRKIKEYIKFNRRYQDSTHLENALYVIRNMEIEAYHGHYFSYSLIQNFLFTSTISEKYKNSVIEVAIFNNSQKHKKTNLKTIKYDVVGVNVNNACFLTPSGFELPMDRVIRVNGEKFNYNNFIKEFYSHSDTRLRNCVLNMTMDEVVKHIEKDKLNYIKEN